MASSSVASYFNVRKRAAADDIVNSRNKVVRLEADPSVGDNSSVNVDRNILAKNRLADGNSEVINHEVGVAAKVVERTQATASKRSAPARRTTKRVKSDAKSLSNQPKIVKFTLGGTLSPRKKSAATVDEEQSVAFQSIEKNVTKTPTKKSTSANDVKQSTSAAVVNKQLTTARKELSFDEIKTKVTRSAKLAELKAILSRRQQLEEQYNACINKRTTKAKEDALSHVKEGQTLKQFDTIELEVLTRLVHLNDFFSIFFPKSDKEKKGKCGRIDCRRCMD